MLLCVWHLRNARGREEGREGGVKSEGGEEDGQGRNLHSEAQIDAKQLLNSCKVEQLLGRRGWRDGGDEGMNDQVRERQTQRPTGHVEILD